MVTSVQKWGNSLALRIPKAFANAAQLEADSLVDISVVEESIVISRIRKPKFTLDGLLSEMTDENLHGEFETGSPAGLEIL